MTHLLARLARAVLLWLLGRRPSTRARRALAWTAAVLACAAALEAGVLGACLAVVWWLLAQLAALLVAAGPPLVLLVAVLAAARRAVRRAVPAPALTELPAPAREPAGSSDSPAPPDVLLEPASSDIAPPRPEVPREADVPVSVPPADAAPAPARRAVDGATRLTSEVAPAAPVEDPLAAEAAWLEAHWAAEPQSNGSGPPAGASAST